MLCLLATFQSSGQNLFDTTRTAEKYYGDTTAYVPTKFELYIKQQVKTSLQHSSRVILACLPGGLVPEYTNAYVIVQKYILLSCPAEKEWVANMYFETIDLKDNSSRFLKSSLVKISENNELYVVSNQWDSLDRDWYLPFVQEVELNGKKGYFPSEASDIGFMNFYAIDTAGVVFKNIYGGSLIEEWSLPGICVQNVNFAYNNTQPTFSAMIFLQKLAESKELFLIP